MYVNILSKYSLCLVQKLATTALTTTGINKFQFATAVKMQNAQYPL